MKTLIRYSFGVLLTLVVTLLEAAPPSPNAKTINFDSDAVGSPPAGFDFARTGNGAEGKWIVRDDKDKPGNHVLVQESAHGLLYDGTAARGFVGHGITAAGTPMRSRASSIGEAVRASMDSV